MSSDQSQDVILSYESLPPVDFESRVKAAASAGFDRIGYNRRDFAEGKKRGFGIEQMREILDREGVEIDELEMLVGFDGGYADRGEPGAPWGPPGLDMGLRYADREVEADMFEMAQAFGCHHLVVGASWMGTPIVPETAARFGSLCDRAAEYDLGIALEFVPLMNIPDVATAAEIVLAADRPNGGIVADIWHHRRSGGDEEALAALPPEKIMAIHLSDGFEEPRDPDYATETLTMRSLPGEGEWDLMGFVQGLRARGVTAPVGIEVLNADLRALGADESARRIAAAWRKVLAS